MSVHAVALFGTLTIFLEVATNRHLRLIKNMEIVAIVAFDALLFDPVHTDKLLPFAFIHMVGQTFRNGGEFVDA